MSAALKVLPFTPADSDDGKALAAFHAYHRAYQTAQEQARAAGLPVDGASALGRMFDAGHRLAALWERRANRLTRQLQAALASDALADDDRASIVRTLTGSTRRDAKLLTASERELLDAYAAVSAADKGAIRRVLMAMAGTSAERAAP